MPPKSPRAKSPKSSAKSPKSPRTKSPKRSKSPATSRSRSKSPKSAKKTPGKTPAEPAPVTPAASSPGSKSGSPPKGQPDIPDPFYAKLSKYATKPMSTVLVLLFALAVGMQFAAYGISTGKPLVEPVTVKGSKKGKMPKATS